MLAENNALPQKKKHIQICSASTISVILFTVILNDALQILPYPTKPHQHLSSL